MSEDEKIYGIEIEDQHNIKDTCGSGCLFSNSNLKLQFPF